MKSSTRVIDLEIPLSERSVPAALPATCAASVTTVPWPRRALNALYGLVFGQFTLLVYSGVFRSSALLGLAGNALALLLKQVRTLRSVTDVTEAKRTTDETQKQPRTNVPSGTRPLCAADRAHDSSL